MWYVPEVDVHHSSALKYKIILFLHTSNNKGIKKDLNLKNDELTNVYNMYIQLHTIVAKCMNNLLQ